MEHLLNCPFLPLFLDVPLISEYLLGTSYEDIVNSDQGPVLCKIGLLSSAF